MAAAEGVPVAVRGQLNEMSAELGLPEALVDRTWRLYGRLYESEAAEDVKGNPLCWLLCIVVAEIKEDAASATEQREPLRNINISDLLRKANVHCKEFMKRMGTIAELEVYSPQTVNDVRRLQQGYVVSCALFCKLRRLVHDTHVKLDDETSLRNSGSAIVEEEIIKMQIVQMTWVLYLLSKEHMKLRCDDLVTSFYLLLCCFTHVLTKAQLNSCMAALGSTNRSGKEHDGCSLMQKICAACHADFAEVNAIFSSKSWYDFISKNLSSPDRAADIQKLRSRYCSLHSSGCNLNELDFCDSPISHLLLPEESSPTRASQSCNDSKDKEAASTGVSSATVMGQPPVPQTPVRSALSTIQQLKALLGLASDSPSEALLQYFEECSVNPREVILKRIEDMRTCYENEHTSQQKSTVTSSTPSQRYQLIVRLFYRVLEGILKGEEKRLARSDFLSLCHNDTFNRALLACCAEVINKTYGHADAAGKTSCASVFGVHPYNLCKIIESFILAEPHLPKEIIQHLQAVENHILEELAWRRDSPLFESVNAAITPLSLLSSAAEISRESYAATSGTASPIRPALLSQQFMSPARPAITSQEDIGKDGLAARRPRSVTVFLNKVCRLGYQRLLQLCSRLGINKDLIARVWTCYEYFILHRWDLLQGRHIDQIMMCCTYGMCKVIENEIKFRRIVDVYKTLPAMRPEVYRTVYISDEEPPDSIVGFYNRVFMQSSKTYLLQFSPTKRRQPPSSPAPKAIAPGSPSMVRKNFYVSPLREPLPRQSHLACTSSTLTPRSMQLFSFGEPGSAEKLRGINEVMRQSAIAAPNSGRKRALDFDSQNINGGEKPKDIASVRKQMRFDDDQPSM